MKILYITSVKEIHFKTFLDLANKNNISVHLISSRKSYWKYENLKLHKIPSIVFKGNNRLIKLFNIDCLKIITKIIINKIKPDIIHAIGVDRWGYIAASANKKNIPLIITCQGSDIFQHPFNNTETFRRVKYSLNKASVVHTLSKDGTIDHLVKNFHLNSSVIFPINWGINIKYIDSIINKYDRPSLLNKFKIKNGEIIIFAPRGLRPVFKPIFSLIKTAKILSNAGLNFKIIFCLWEGYKKLKSAFINEINSQEVGDKFILIDKFLDHEEILPIYHMSDITISLSESDETAAAILEAMYLGSVPLVSNTGTYKHHFQENDNLFFAENYNVDKLTEKLKFIMQNLDHIKNDIIKNNNVLIRTKYNREKNSEKIYALYNTLT